MATYTTIPLIDLEKIATHYGLKIINSSPITGGNANSNYHIQTDECDYIFTLAEEKSLPEVQKLADLLAWLKQHQFISSSVHSTALGETVTQYKEKPLLVKKWLAGTVHENLDTNMLLQIGYSIAKLHQIPAPEFLPKFYSCGLQVFATVINKSIDNEYETWLAEQIQFFSINLPKNLPKGLIHGDIFFDNVLFEGEKLKAIIDFEEACHYDLIFDIGMAILGLCRTDGKIEFAKAKALIKGYEQIRPLLSLEKKSLLLYIEYGATATSWWRFWKYNIHSSKPDSNNKHWEMVEVAKDMHRFNTTEFSKNIFST